MLKKLSLTAIAVSMMSVSALTAAPKLDASLLPPGGLAVNNVPVFIVIGSDDNGAELGIDWIVNFLADKKNPTGKGTTGTFDDAPIHMSFFVNGNYAANASKAWQRAFDAGHEIGNHTFDHLVDPKTNEAYDGRVWTKEQWSAEIILNDSVIFATTTVTAKENTGFRTPRLEYSEGTFQVLAERGFTYDCSIEEGSEEGQDGTNYYWPYTLDNGSIADSLQVEWSTGKDDWGYKTCGKTAGLFELPVYNYLVVPDSLAERYGVKTGLRDSAFAHIDYFDKDNGRWTGFDYNLIASYENGGLQMDSITFLSTFKFSLDQRLDAKANRVPFTLGMHTDYYFPEDAAEDAKMYPNITPAQRRGAIEEFVKYALTKPEVRFVTAAQMVAWMQNPVGLDGTVGDVSIDAPKKLAKEMNITAGTKSVTFTAPSAGHYSLSIYSVNGSLISSTSKNVGSAGSTSISFGKELANGMYVAKVTGMNSSSITKFSIQK